MSILPDWILGISWTDEERAALSATQRAPIVFKEIPPLPPSHCGHRARCDFPGHVLVRMGNTEYGMDLAVALRLRRDLDAAINTAAGYD